MNQVFRILIQERKENGKHIEGTREYVGKFLENTECYYELSKNIYIDVVFGVDVLPVG